MDIETPILKLGLAGFTAQQQDDEVLPALQAASSAVAGWQLAPFGEADAWWFDGGRTQVTPEGLLRVSPGVPTSRAVQLNLPDVDRPVAFSLPLHAPGFKPPFSFVLNDRESTTAVLNKFRSWLQPQIAQFALAAYIVQNEVSLGGGPVHILRDHTLLAVSDGAHGLGVMPTATVADFTNATWVRRPAMAADIPETFLKASFSQVLWQFALRSRRDHLPKHYRSRPLYFRRTPRLSQRLMRDSQLMVMRELAALPGTFEELQHRTGLAGLQLARDLTALYFVGAITSNPKRAGTAVMHQVAEYDSRHQESQASVMPSGLDSRMPGGAQPLSPDVTVVAPLTPN